MIRSVIRHGYGGAEVEVASDGYFVSLRHAESLSNLTPLEARTLAEALRVAAADVERTRQQDLKDWKERNRTT